MSSRSVSPPMLGEIKTGTPLDVTLDNSLLESVPTTAVTEPVTIDVPADNLVQLTPPEVNNSNPAMDIDPSESDVEEEDPIDKMRSMEILPDLFNLIHDVIQGKIQPKDFHNNAGSLRLKLNTLKQYMQEVEGIGETLQSTQAKIESLRENNEKKRALLE
ncbi:uncharacterized protein SPAPADRAFT_63695, partial [Spathaspora passalidarum NRRL Y-27907]